MHRKIARCKSCGDALLPQRSILDMLAAKLFYCPWCMEADAAEQRMDQQAQCDHAWGSWEGEAGYWRRFCVRCEAMHVSYCKTFPTEHPDLDISWCNLDRTTPEP